LALALDDAFDSVEGLSSWVDRELKRGRSWAREIEHQIDDCDLFLILLSPDVNRRATDEIDESFVITEIHRASYIAKPRKPILPVMAQLTTPPLEIGTAQYLDVTQLTLDKAIELIVEDVCEFAGIETPREREEEEQRERQAAERQAHAKTEVEKAVHPIAEPTAQPEEFSQRVASATPSIQKSGMQNRVPLVIGVVVVLMFIIGIVGVLALNGSGQETDPEESISSNDEWEPISREFDGVEMVLVPAGCFMMGSERGDNDEKPVHEQCFEEPFWIDLTEVTQADFEHLGGQKENNNSFDGANRPVERITWFEARDFCQLRGMRLPTEREWEYAARGPDNLVYPWGNEWNENNAIWSGNSDGETVEVGSISNGASWVGALDMSGNVWEWTSSLFEDYPYEDDHEDASDTNDSRALRSGSWYDNGAQLLRATNRYGASPDNWINYLGFRCARSSN
jgi:formylglycine-generating enzyme required for sulfatase activity